MKYPIIGLLLLALVATGCTSSSAQNPVRLRGIISSMDQPDPANGVHRGDPMVGAQIDLHCPDRAPERLGESDEAGRFSYADEKKLSRDCQITITGAGYASRTYSLDNICATPSWSEPGEEGYDSTCDYAGLTAQLLTSEDAR